MSVIIAAVYWVSTLSPSCTSHSVSSTPLWSGYLGSSYITEEAKEGPAEAGAGKRGGLLASRWQLVMGQLSGLRSMK